MTLACWSHEIRISNRGARGGKLFIGSNARESWQAKASRTKTERRAVHRAWRDSGQRVPPAFPARVTFVRHSAGTMDDDNIRAAYKSARDELAKLFGLRNDAGPEIVWEYVQAHAKRGEAFTIIRITCVYQRTTGEREEVKEAEPVPPAGSASLERNTD
jgi:hypothetical protein